MDADGDVVAAEVFASVQRSALSRKATTMKNWQTMIGISALLMLAACAATPEDGQEPSTAAVKEDAPRAADPKMGTRMKSQCMVNDDGTEAICCGESDCFYVDLRPYDPYAYR